jgi:transcriptional regulator of acetoin/glycerol metabolism
VDERVPAPAGDPGLPPVELPTEIMTEAYHVAKDLVIAHFEKAYLAHLVERSGGNMSRAARLANIDRTTIYRMMERHQLTRAQLPGLIS